MMKRRLLALLLALTMTASLAACGGQETPEEDPDSSVEEQLPEPTEDGESTDPEESEEEAPEAPQADEETARPEEEETPAQKPAGSKPQQEPAEKPQAPAQKPAEPPAQTPQTPEKPASVDLAAFVAALPETAEWPALMKAEGEVLDSYYAGLSEIATNQCEVHTAMISAAVGEIALVEVQNADDAQKVKDIFQARVNYQVGDETNPGAAMYPATIEGWKNGSRIVSNGNYVMLVALSEGADSVVTAFNALFS